jgi:hypothetical protein
VTREQDSGGLLTKNSVVLWTLAIGGLLTITLVVALLYDQTPWDWLRILIVPAVIAIGGFLLNRSQREREIKIAEQRAKTDREIADQRSKDAAVQAYFDQMAQLLADDKVPLDEGSKTAKLRMLVRARTKEVLWKLDPHRKRNLLQFLHEAGLIVGDNNIVGLIGADLRDAYLKNLNLRDANLEGADLKNANLSEADLHGAILRGADLTYATITEEQLANCKTLVGAILPDGSKHP